MIVKNFAAQNFFDKKNIFLFYGENEGLKDEVFSKLSIKYNKENRFSYYEQDVLNNLENFYTGVLSQSFFNDKKLILVKGVTDKFLNQVETLLDKEIGDVIMVLNASMLEKKSKIRNFFEKNNNVVCVPFYKDDKNTLSNIAHLFFKSKKINISQEAINIIVSRSSEDRKNLKNELNKIELYLGNKKAIKENDLNKITNLVENYPASKIVDHALAKEIKIVFKILNENIFHTDDNLIIIRSFLAKSKRLLKLVKQLNNNIDLDQLISSYRPPIFWKEKDIVKKQLKIWNKESLYQLIKDLNKIELLVKKNSDASKSILYNFVVEKSDFNNTIS